MAEAIVHLPDAMHEVTMHVRVTGKRQVKARIWVGAQVMKLAALIMGCNVEIG